MKTTKEQMDIDPDLVRDDFDEDEVFKIVLESAPYGVIGFDEVEKLVEGIRGIWKDAHDKQDLR